MTVKKQDMSKKQQSTNKSTNYVNVSKKEYEIFKLLTENGYSATGGKYNVKDALGYNSHSVVIYHINNLKKIGILKCINPRDKVKFYEAVPGINVIPVSRRCVLHINSKKSGRVPDNSLWIKDKKIRRRNKKTGRFIKSTRIGKMPVRHYDTIAYQDGQRQNLCRVHSESFKANITGGPIDKVRWDNVSSPNHRFHQHDIKWPVPGVGSVSFRWIKSKNKNFIVIFLPEKYLLPYELEAEDKILKEMAGKAATWFSINAYKLKRNKKAKRNRIGIGPLSRYRATHYAYMTTPKQKKYFDKHGTVIVDTASGGKAGIDSSKKPFVEQEYTNLEDAKVINELKKPGHFVVLKNDIQDIKEIMKKLLEENKKKFDLQEERWKEQKRFNYMIMEIVPWRKEFKPKSFRNINSDNTSWNTYDINGGVK